MSLAIIVELAKKYKDIKEVQQTQEDALEVTTLSRRAIEAEILEVMVENEIASTRIDDVGLLTMKSKTYLSVTNEHKPDFYVYMKDEAGASGLFKETIADSTLTAFLGEHLNNLMRKEMDAGLDEVDARNKVLEFLNQKGASYFTKRGVSLKSK